MKTNSMTLNKKTIQKNQDQQQLILLVCIPCISITTISLLLAGISYYLIAFIFIILSLLCIYVIVASAQRSEHQIRTLSNIIESMIDGDYSLRGRLHSNHAFQELLTLVNDLAENLSLHKVEAKESRLLLERIMEQMDAMVLAVNEQGYLVMANASAKKLLLNDVQDITQCKLSHHPIGTQIVVAPICIINFKDNLTEENLLTGEHFLFKESFLSEGQQHQLYTLTNAERLLMEQERKTWQNLLRVLSHEMNNSLTPISAISQSIKQKLKNTEQTVNRSSLLEGINIIHERADSLSSFIASYSQLSHLPLPNKICFELKPLIEKNLALFPQLILPSSKQNFCPANLLVTADKGQLEQVIINLLKNAHEAMEKTVEKNIEIECLENDKWLKIFIKDQGQGIANFDNLFVPFYSTKPTGSGIGLSLCRQILFNHQGTINISNRGNKQGAEAIICLPINN
jgi:nitrogen fixation/metabolism regulation signal transduction histidine kinase